MKFAAIRELSLPAKTTVAAALLLALSSPTLWAQQRPADGAKSARQTQAERPSKVRPVIVGPAPATPRPAPPPIRTVRPITPSPATTPRPVNAPAVRPLGVLPVQPAPPAISPSPLVPRPLGVAPLKVGGSVSPSPVPVRPILAQRPPKSLIPASTQTVQPTIYCSPWSVMYNTGSICFNPDLLTIDPKFEFWLPYVPPPIADASGQIRYSPYPPELFLRYCPACSLENAGIKVGGIPPRPTAEKTPTAVTQFVAPSRSPIVLVLTDGTTALVSRYWLGRDWLLHFVTVNGQQRAISLNQLNRDATATFNFHRGVVFVLPAWPEP